MKGDRKAFGGTLVASGMEAIPTRFFRVIPSLVLLAMVDLGAQEEEPPPEVEEPDTLVSYELSDREAAVLREYFPAVHEKLLARQPVHTVMIGDSISDLWLPTTDHDRDWVRSYPYYFLNRLSERFYYTGGVRLTNPKNGRPTKLMELVGPEMTMAVRSQVATTALYANQALLAGGLQHRPDLVILNFGTNDANGGLSLSAFEAALREAIVRVRQVGAEPILLGPALNSNSWGELAETRTFNLAMKNLAQRENVWFGDLGQLDWLIAAPPPGAEPGMRIDRVLEDLRAWYCDVDLIHPGLLAHERFGRELFREFLGTEASDLLELREAWVSEIDPSGFKAHLRVSPRGQASERITVAPLPTDRRFVSGDGPRVLDPEDLDADGSWTVTMDYRLSEDENGPVRPLVDLLDAMRRPAVPLHWLVMDAERVELLDAAAAIEPVGVRWDLRPVWNAGTTAEQKIELVAGRESVEGSYRATWLGQATSGNFSLAAGEREIVELQLPVPEDLRVTGRTDGDLRLEVETNLGVGVFERRLAGLRNIALGEPVPLRPDVADAAPGNVDLTADAGPEGLSLTFDVAVDGLDSSDMNPHAIIVDLNLDARGYEQRQRRGGTDSIRFGFPADTGDGTLLSIRPWSFGTGYGMKYPAEGFSTSIAEQDEGLFRVEIMIPSGYLYLHEWALGNPRSQLGINVQLSLLRKSEQYPEGRYPASARWSLVRPPGPRDDTSSLSRIELSEERTGRWSYRLW